ncbi:C-factor [Paramyrothecium foliicola]|nr:C-factor [Paramyrothecium foliicola]
MTLPWVFICPSSRGIGYALTRRILQTTSLPILASTRSADPAATKAALLEGMPDAEDVAPRLSIVQLDVTDDSSIAAAAERAHELFPPGKYHLRLACGLAGVLHPEKHPRQVDPAKSAESFAVNAVGQLLLLKHFGEMLPKRATEMAPAEGLAAHATWCSMSARVGSVADNRTGGWYSYRASKAAVNSIVRSFDIFLRARSGDKALAVAYHPGTVRTDLSRDYWAGVPEGKLFAPEYAAERMMAVLAGLTAEQRGRTWDWKNTEVPP